MYKKKKRIYRRILAGLLAVGVAAGNAGMVSAAEAENFAAETELLTESTAEQAETCAESTAEQTESMDSVMEPEEPGEGLETAQQTETEAEVPETMPGLEEQSEVSWTETEERQADPDEGNESAVVRQMVRSGSIAADAAHFPDAVFREYVLEYLAGDDGILSAAEMNAVKYLEFYYEDVSSLQGIEYFPNLQYLYCEGNNLTSLDLRKMSNLKEVECSDNALTSLKVSGLGKLRRLICSDNNLSSLALTKLPALTELECSNNNLSVLNVKALGNLQYLVCSSNKIKSLDLSGMKNLLNVDCEGNGMGTLKLGELPMLTVLLCGTNSLTSLDISGIPKLRVLYCYQNRLNGLDCTSNTALQELEAFTNNMSWLNLTGVSSLLSINCSANRIAALDVASASGLVNLIADNNCLPALNLAKNKKLQKVSLIGQTASAAAIQTRNACQVDLSASGFNKSRVQNLSSGSLYANGITWKTPDDIPANRIVTYISKTGRSGITFPVTLKITGVKTWTPTPGKVNLYRVKNTKGRKISVKWKKVPAASGYRIQYSTSSKFKKSKTKTITLKKGNKKSQVLKGLKKGKTYYVRVRAYQTYKGKKYYGAFSRKKKVKIKK